MPLFMDVHESLPDGATVKDVVGAHRQPEHPRGVRREVPAYWVDEADGKVFAWSRP